MCASRLFSLYPPRAWGERGFGLFRSAAWRTVSSLRSPVGFFHFGNGVGKQAEYVAEAAANALPPILPFLADVTIFFVPIVQELAHGKFRKWAEGGQQMALERFRRGGWIEVRPTL